MRHVAGCLALAAVATTVIHLAYWGMRPGTLIVIASTAAGVAHMHTVYVTVVRTQPATCRA